MEGLLAGAGAIGAGAACTAGLSVAAAALAGIEFTGTEAGRGAGT